MSNSSAFLILIALPVFLLFFLEKINSLFLRAIEIKYLKSKLSSIFFYTQLLSLFFVAALFYVFVNNFYFSNSIQFFFFILIIIIFFFFLNSYTSLYKLDFFSILISFFLFFFSYINSNYLLLVLSTEVTNILILNLVYRNVRKQFRLFTSSNIYYILTYNFIGAVIALFFLNNYLIDTGSFTFNLNNDNSCCNIYLIFFLLFKIGISPLFFYNFYFYKSLSLKQIMWYNFVISYYLLFCFIFFSSFISEVVLLYILCFSIIIAFILFSFFDLDKVEILVLSSLLFYIQYVCFLLL